MSTRHGANEPTLARALGRTVSVSRHFYRLYSPQVPVGYGPFRVAHLTDLHVGAMTPEARLAAAVTAVNALEADVVCMTGDYVAHSLKYLQRLTHHLRSLRGVCLATLGNHDHWHGAAAVTRALESAGVHVLNNASVRIDTGSGPWRFVGIDDAVTGHHNIDQAFVDHQGEPTIVLSHLAELALSVDRRGAVLVLAGHTHGGQVRAGGVMERFMRRLGHRYILGWYRVGETSVYVNRGIGAAVFPWRTTPAAAEVAGIELLPDRRHGERTGVSDPIEIEHFNGVSAWPARGGGQRPRAMGESA